MWINIYTVYGRRAGPFAPIQEPGRSRSASLPAVSSCAGDLRGLPSVVRIRGAGTGSG
jgi:hypothetical protein